MRKYGLKLITTIMILIAVLAPGFGGCTSEEAAAVDVKKTSEHAKYVFLFIGDGMGTPQRSSAELYMAATEGSAKPENISLVMNDFPAQGMSTTYADGAVITDSAASATALACGYKTASGVVAMNTAKTMEYPTMAEMAKDKGWKVGIVSSVDIDHATPACFYSHQPTRKNYYEIGVDLANSDFDYFGGGDILSPTGSNGDQPDVYEMAKKNGFTLIDSRAGFETLNTDSGKVWVTTTVDSSKALYYELDRPDSHISLAEFTAKAIEVLDNPEGFFIMVEGGKIDWACHANDAASAIWDTIAFDEAVAEAVEFYNAHPDDTLIVVTGDHECGGMTIGFAGTGYGSFYDKLENQVMSFDGFDKWLNAYKESHDSSNARFEDTCGAIEDAFGLVTSGDSAMALTEYELTVLNEAFEMSMLDDEVRANDDATYLLYGGYEPFTVTLTHILNQKSGIAWTSYSHTGVPVPVSAMGVGEDQFNGYYDNTEVATKIMDIAVLK